MSQCLVADLPRRRAPFWSAAVLLAAALALTACSSPDAGAQAAATEGGEAPAAGSEEFPNLGDVPDQPPESTPRVEREKLLQELAADRANAEYTDESLDASSVQPSAAPPPAPGLAAPEATESAADGEAADEEAEPPPPPPEIAALPDLSGDAAAVIFFRAGSDQMTDRDRAILHEVALLQRRQHVPRLTVIGHASKAESAAEGTPEDMALARATAVAAQLMQEGVPSSVVQTATGPVTYDESGSQGGAPNQRVEILVGN
jgi:outer membrane protein OmpA-like peptidoglycan-associated protein